MIRKIIFTSLFSFILLLSYGQEAKRTIDAIGNTNYQVLKKHMDEQLELCILEEPDFVSKKEAIRQLKLFLERVKPKSINSFHQGSSKNRDSKYAVANLLTQNGTFRVFVYSEKKGGKQVIKEIRIDNQ